MEHTIRVLVVDDHAIVRQGLRAMLESKGGIEVIGEAGDGEQAVVQAQLLRPDVILMDLEMPHKSGISATQEIIAAQPDARILILSSFSDDAQIVESMRAGALGYLLKTAKLDDLVNAIRQINEGETPLNPLVARRLLVSISPPRMEPRLLEVLTDRELMILPLVVRGMTNKEIGDRLGIATRTVGTHIGNMIRKAEVDNRVQLSMLAVRQGLTSLYADEN
ncbi:MAG TPA: response regulator transcription factor [Promineifilum sp.]|nr:response regulator transcription factor [Promineifilum sp.]HRO24948.1 response regulator transcription factor [Promineifilum sp.]HRO91452.1 response regulator transcription factor [Promineifilum sp.]HRQ14208.1 response regulator transcription factor [Promineifilum sp.]